ncbi:MAG TPA: type II and III secretion system protein family protein [Dongiaceae bacterium]|nr:type II and III secretion system protein family protein [Dongiaceae bacterium]
MKRRFILALCSALIVAGAPPQAYGQARPAEIIGGSTQSMQIEVSKGNLIRLERPAGTAFIADPSIADIQVKSARLIYVFGKKPGETTLYAVDDNEQMLANFRIVVTHNLSRLRNSLRGALPDGGVSVDSVEGTVVMSGSVNSPVEAEDARRLAASYLPADQEVLNRVRVEGANQINLRVRIAEVSRQVVKQLGFNWDAAFSNSNFLFGIAQGGPVTSAGNFLTRNPAALTSGAQGNVNNLLGSFSSNNFNTNALIDALEAEGLVTVLAEPNLTALTGEAASFLAGGEFPIPVAQSSTSSSNTITVQFKQFGVSLAFVPTVLNDKRISLRVRPEVSQLSTEGAVSFSNIQIPALTTRRAETTVELGSGQSFAIAGLLQNNTTHDISRFPGLGDLPILGTLFRSDRFRRNETELVIIVTPYLVKPISTATRLQTPVDGFVPPNDQDRVINGMNYRPQLRQRPVQPLTGDGRGLAGPSGFVVE